VRGENRVKCIGFVAHPIDAKLSIKQCIGPKAGHPIGFNITCSKQ
jgi:hypothetical protein